MMRTTTVFALAFLASSLLVSAQESDEANAVLQTERDLAMAYQRGDADRIAQGVMEDYTLTSSTGKVTTRSDDIAEAKKTIRNTRSSRITTCRRAFMATPQSALAKRTQKESPVANLSIRCSSSRIHS